MRPSPLASIHSISVAWQNGQMRRGYQCTRLQLVHRGSISLPSFAPSQNGWVCSPFGGIGLS